MQQPDAAAASPVRIAPTVMAGVAIWFAYMLATLAVQASAGVPCTDRFTTAAHAWRVGVLSLLVSTLLLALQVLVAGLGMAMLVGLFRNDRTQVLP